MVLQGVILHKTDKWGIKNKNFLNVVSFSKILIFQTYVYVIWAIDIHRFTYFGTQAYFMQFRNRLSRKRYHDDFRSFEIVNFFLNRQFLIFLYKSNMYRIVVKRENYETRKRLKLANCASTFFACCLFAEQCKNKHRIVIHEKKGNISCYARISIRTSKWRLANSYTKAGSPCTCQPNNLV